MPDYPLIRRSEALDAAEKGACVVTHNQRLAGALRREYGERQREAGRGAWPAPDILPWGAWLSRILDDARHDGGPALPWLLSPLQERVLWERVLAESPEGEALLQPAGAAQIWKRLRSRDTLRVLDEAARLDLLAEAAGQALTRVQRDRPRTLTGPFLALKRGPIVDCKTGSHDGGDLEAFLDRERERYSPLAKYARPLPGGWREWDRGHP